MKNVLVTGGNGQLATCIKDLENHEDDLNFIYTDYLDLDICDLNKVKAFFKSNNLDYCVNCAAYTAVDKAETEADMAFEINAIGAKNLAIACNENHVVLIHISTDFVFDGKRNEPYKETDLAEPICVYGASKLQGEIEIQETLKEHFIVRTSWLYSEHGNNFMKTMLYLAKTRNELSVVNDQIGTPTYAGDLAKVIVHIIKMDSQDYGLYHYSNLGQVSWFGFAKAIFEFSVVKIKLSPIPTTSYPTPAKRPMYSVMDKSKMNKAFGFNIFFWEDSLKIALSKLELNNNYNIKQV